MCVYNRCSIFIVYIIIVVVVAVARDVSVVRFPLLAGNVTGASAREAFAVVGSPGNRFSGLARSPGDRDGTQTNLLPGSLALPAMGFLTTPHPRPTVPALPNPPQTQPYTRVRTTLNTRTHCTHYTTPRLGIYASISQS